MNLRDYLLLKVEIEGTSGEGSVAVKSFRQVSVTAQDMALLTGVGTPLWQWQLARDETPWLSRNARWACGRFISLQSATMHARQHSACLLSCRDKIRGLFDPFLAAAPEAAASPCPAGVTVSISVQAVGPGSGCAAACESSATSDAAAAQQSAILAVYQQPDRHAGLYNYAKALESVESALLTSAKGTKVQRKAGSCTLWLLMQ